MNLNGHRTLLSFLEDYEGLIKAFCDNKDGKFDSGAKGQVAEYIADQIKAEDGRLKMHQDEELHKKFLIFHNAVLELMK